MSIARFVTEKTTPAQKESGKFGAWFTRYRQSLRFGLYVITHPFDGFWDLTHEKKGSLAAANTFLFFFLLTRVLKQILTSFQFISRPLQHFSILEEVLSLLAIFLVICIGNWAMTTLFNGKGRFKDIYMALCYALVPYTLLQLPMTFISNGLTYEEGSLYSVIMTVALICCAFLAFVGMMEVHDYGPGKTLIFLIVTVLAALVIIFLVLVFFSLLSDAVAYLISMYREIVYRLY